MRESDIEYEAGDYWVGRERIHGGIAHTVYRNTSTHAVSDSSYLDLSVAIARCNYLARPRASAFNQR